MICFLINKLLFLQKRKCMPKKVDEKRVPKSLSWDARLFEAVNNIAVKGGYKSLSAFIEDLLIKNTDIVNEYIRLGKKKKK